MPVMMVLSTEGIVDKFQHRMIVRSLRGFELNIALGEKVLLVATQIITAGKC